LGARDTVFETPNGLDSGNHHSTAYDLAIITREAICNEKFMIISNTRDITFRSDKKTYSMHNKNRLLYGFEGANGVKTGFTTKAGHCFVGAAKRGGMQLISVVLASGWGSAGKEQKWKDTRAILEFGFDNFRYYNIVEAESFAGNLEVERSRTPFVDYYFSDGVNIPLTSQEYENLEIEINAPELIRAPIEKGGKVGEANLLLYGEPIIKLDLLAAQSAKRTDFKAYLEKIINEWLSMGTGAEPNVILPESTPDL
jgi:D-alanyl-D-alanine carboxypeptidase (penicillin-binding protein 5/6)